MFVLDSVACSDTMPADGQSGGAQLIAQAGSNGGFFSIKGADVYMQLGFIPQRGLSVEWTPELHASVGNGVLARGTCGVRFRNYIAGQTATVSAGLSEPAEPSVQLTAGGDASPTATTAAKHADVNTSALGDTTLVTAAAGLATSIIGLFLMASGAVTVSVTDGAGGSNLIGPVSLIANTGMVLPFNPVAWHVGSDSTALVLHLSAAVQVGGVLVYSQA